jgi:alkaline phosphatase
MRILVCLLLCLNCAFGQEIKYTVANAHAHNDYNHPVPFYTAFNAGFGSIEADIFLRDGQLFVAHNRADIRDERTLAALYLEPLQKENIRPLLLLIDIKTAAEPTLDALLKLLGQYKKLTGNPLLKIVITGNQPDVSKLTSYPSWLFFDGRPQQNYPPDALEKIALISDDFKNYSSWEKIKPAVEKAHQLNKPIRFWATPDDQNAWEQLMKLQVDYINTDKIQELANFLSAHQR